MIAAIYARVSTETQEKQETIESQLEALREHAAKNNYSIHEEYIDEGYSGDLLDRPALDRLRDDARNRLFNTVLVHSPDRLSRKFLYSALVQEELKKYGVNLVFLNRPDSKDTPEENLLTGIQGLIAEYEKAKMLERTRRGKIYKAKNNQLMTSIPPYGYRYIQNDRFNHTPGHYEIEEQEAEVVRLIFELFLDKNLSVRAIARELTQMGVPPRQGRRWRTSTIHRLLRNETYAGVTYYNKHISVEIERNGYRRAKNTGRRLRPKDQWIPIMLPKKLRIIDRETFEAVQKQLLKNSELSPRHVKYQYLLRGLVRCGLCGSPFQGTPFHGRLFYRCGNRHRTFPLERKCRAPVVKAEKLEGAVWEKFCEAVRDPYIVAEQITRLKENRTKELEGIHTKIDSIDRRLKSLTASEDRLLDAYREGIISIEQLRGQMAKVQEMKSHLHQERQMLIEKQSSSPEVIEGSVYEYCQLIKERLSSLKDDFDSKRYLLLLAINEITLEDKVARIKCIIPVQKQDGCIASISSAHYDRLQQQPRVPFLRVPGL